MTKPLSTMNRKQLAVIGAAVADAASLGMHWLYDQNRIKTLQPEAPEFHVHKPEDYAGVPAYFAHINRTCGQFSHYGEQLKTMLLSLSGNNGEYDKTHYETSFVEAFGYGGSYVGYIDHPTRDTLNNISLAENKALAKAEALPFNGDDNLKRKLISKVLGNVKQFEGDKLREKIEEAVRITDDEDYLVQHAMLILDELSVVAGFHGADDRQLPALSKLPPLIALYADDSKLATYVDSAVRVTNDNDDAAEFAAFGSVLLATAIQTGDLAKVIETAKSYKSDLVSPLMTAVFENQALSSIDATALWGMACDLNLGIPSIVHNLLTTTSYTEAIRTNIYAGGDSCGRSILLGAILGACYSDGVPAEWFDKLSDKKVLVEHLSFLDE